MGEKLALQTINRFAESVKTVHQPGARVLIVSDGRVFSDLVGVSDENVTNYQRIIRSLHTGENICWIGLEDFFPNSKSHDDLRSKFMTLYGKPNEIIEKKIKVSFTESYFVSLSLSFALIQHGRK